MLIRLKANIKIIKPEIWTNPIIQIFILLKLSTFFNKNPYNIVPNPPVIKFKNRIHIPFSLFSFNFDILGLKKIKLWKIPTYIELK